MNTLDITNPQIITEVFSRKFLRLSETEREQQLSVAYDNAVRFAKEDDSELCAKLNSEQLDEYSILISTFKSALDQVRDLEGLLTHQVAIPFVANLIAWQHVVSTFRHLNG